MMVAAMVGVVVGAWLAMRVPAPRTVVPVVYGRHWARVTVTQQRVGGRWVRVAVAQ
jgi:hypothetical protein